MSKTFKDCYNDLSIELSNFKKVICEALLFSIFWKENIYKLLNKIESICLKIENYLKKVHNIQ